MKQDTLEYLQRAIEFAPRDPGHLSKELRGWITTDELFFCTFCGGRIIARGCALPRGVDPVWNDKSGQQLCCLCGETK